MPTSPRFRSCQSELYWHLARQSAKPIAVQTSIHASVLIHGKGCSCCTTCCCCCTCCLGPKSTCCMWVHLVRKLLSWLFCISWLQSDNQINAEMDDNSAGKFQGRSTGQCSDRCQDWGPSGTNELRCCQNSQAPAETFSAAVPCCHAGE